MQDWMEKKKTSGWLISLIKKYLDIGHKRVLWPTIGWLTPETKPFGSTAEIKLFWTRHRLELRTHWLNTSKLQSYWASLIGRPSVCKWGVSVVTAHCSCVWQMAMGYVSMLLDWNLFALEDIWAAIKSFSTPELSFTSFQTPLLLSGGEKSDDCATLDICNPPPTPPALDFPFLFLSPPMPRERGRAHWPSKTPIGTKTESLRVQPGGQAKKKLKLGNRKSLRENQWSTQMIVTRKMTWPPPFSLHGSD